MESPVYISGPMTGLPDFNYPAFNAAAKALRALGYEVFNPAEQGEKPTWEDYMRHAIKGLMDCKSMVLLDGAHSSNGAMLEMQLAHALGIKMVPFEKLPQARAA